MDMALEMQGTSGDSDYYGIGKFVENSRLQEDPEDTILKPGTLLEDTDFEEQTKNTSEWATFVRGLFPAEAKESVIKKTNSSINLTINNAGDPNEVLERSSSFSTLVGNPNSKIRSLSRKFSISVGTNLEKKNRKESISALTPTRTVRGHLRSMNSSIDSPGKRKLSPESTNSTLKKMRSDKQTTGDSNQPQTGFHF